MYSSLEDTVKNFAKQQSNALEITKAFAKIASQQDETVEVKLTNGNGEIESISLPSIVKIQSEINRLDKNITNLAGVKEGATYVRLSDGSFRQIHLSKIESRPDDIEFLQAPTTFKNRVNWFFENFITPYLFIELDVSGQIDNSIRKALVKRYILNTDTDYKIQLFNNTFLNQSSINYDTFLEKLRNENITYQIDEEIVDLPLSTINFVGNFSVLSVRDENITRNIGGIAKTATTRIYTLNKLTYIDYSDESNPSIRNLSVGDYVYINNTAKNTRFKVIYVDAAQQEIALERIEGYEPVKPGDNILSIYSPISASKKIEIGIGYNERQVIFVKPISNDWHLSSANFSPGVGIYTNNLTINLPADLGGKTNLENFYKRFTVDIGAHFLSIGREKPIPAMYAEIPNAPVLNAANFKVVQINRHITESNEAQRIKELFTDKISLESEIEDITNRIRTLREFLANNQIFDETRRMKEKDLSNAIQNRRSKTQLLRSIADEIISLNNTNPNLTTSPKYRVRGFWSIPEPKKSNKTRDQEVIQFVIRYRYIRNDGGVSNPDLIEYIDSSGNTRTGVFSRWNEYKTDILERKFDARLNRYVWVQGQTENADDININQLDIPINYGESVEIKVKSISEAGWPTTQISSEFSKSIIISFPQELVNQGELSENLVRQAIEEKTRFNLLEELESIGLNEHLTQQINTGSKFYAHPASSLSVIDSNGQVKDLQNVISQLIERINKLELQLFNQQSTIVIDDMSVGY